jgi:hypothetical protein
MAGRTMGGWLSTAMACFPSFSWTTATDVGGVVGYRQVVAGLRIPAETAEFRRGKSQPQLGFLYFSVVHAPIRYSFDKILSDLVFVAGYGGR